MILVAGIPTEPPVAAVIAALEAAGGDHAVLNQRAIAHVDTRLVVSGRGAIDGTLTIDGRQWPINEVTGAYARMMVHTRLPEHDSTTAPSELRKHSDRENQTLSWWMDLAQAQIINRPRAMASNGSKPFQAQLIRRHGFSTPDTVITNDPDIARCFIGAHGDVVFKSASGLRSVVQRFGADDAGRLDAIRTCPVQFQEYVAGVNVRVHVIGRQCFASEVTSEAVDYRYAVHQVGTAATLRPKALANDIAAQCVLLSRGLGLVFSGIDLLMGDDGRVVCLEVNPSPGFTYFEDQTGQPIADAVARQLIAHDVAARS